MSQKVEEVLPEADREGVGPAEFARRILERGEVARVRGPLKRVKSKGARRIAFMKEASVKGSLGWLVRSGGWRVRHVVSGKRRREGRLWGPGIFEALDLRFSAQALELLAAAAGWCHGAQPVLPQAQELGPLAPVALGDVVLTHLVLDALLDATPLPQDERPPEPPKPETPPPPGTKTTGRTAKKPSAPTPAPVPFDPDKARAAQLVRRRALVALSPLTALFRADELLADDKLATAEGWTLAVAQAAKLYAPLLAGDRAVLLTYLDDAVAIRWIERESARRVLPAGEAAGRYMAFAAALEGLSAAARSASRPDATRPLLRFFERYLVRFGQREAVVSGFKNHSLTLVRASDRARFLGQVARLFAVSRVVATESERVLATPFVDRSEADKVFLADASEWTRNVLPELEAIRRELAGEVG